ncbi:S-adenosyl-L-methionine-dependent methyltransferase [Lentinula edodes]|uniref:S-adenosyl-L-methionine-dependent methyltransferase n=1 Tax=Lentinula edodes TaxID=5353 RepID=UPI001E8CCBB8|nr:S-adenosyl-L-methionine-dependent methyltransferase [Lentinula edodes]KAH7875000.1 S-adenosyl-L-methionine-dependent methyltransferase [Lentinula edodes]
MLTNTRAFDNTHITALTDLINNAVNDVIIEYAAVGHAVPSLDTLEPGPFQHLKDTPGRMTRAIQIIEAACAQLCSSIAPPGSIMINKSLEHNEPACLLVVTEAKIADFLLDKPGGLPASELASYTGLDAMKLTRILRFLATNHCFKEVTPGVFANNRLSMKLLSSDPVSSLVCMFSDECLKSSAYLNETLTDPSEMDEGIAFRRATGYSFFEYHQMPQGLRKGNRFAKGMPGYNDVSGKSLMVKAYPWTSQPPDITICDVGGGYGDIILDLMKAHPHFKLVLQDQPQIIDMARKFWEEEYPEAIQIRVQLVPFDFFKDTAVQGCDFYYLCSVLHDWPDTGCVLILKNVRKAMKPGSRVIIHDTVLRKAVRIPNQSEPKIPLDGDTATQQSLQLDVAPEPLLPNYGVGCIRKYKVDITMLALMDAKARTLSEYIELGDKSSLRFEKLYKAGETDMMEFTPV